MTYDELEEENQKLLSEVTMLKEQNRALSEHSAELAADIADLRREDLAELDFEGHDYNDLEEDHY